MEKLKLIGFALLYTSILSCSKINSSDFFNFTIIGIPDKEIDNQLHPVFVGTVDDNLDMCILYDEIIISANLNNNYLFSISSLGNNSAVEYYCPKGRGTNELITSMPISEILSDGDNLSAYLFSPVGRKLAKWEISSSIEERRTIYSDVITLGNSRDYILPLKSIFQLHDNNVIAYNTGQIGERYMTPSYEIYSCATGGLVKSLNLFNKIELNTNDELYTHRIFLSLSDCIHPNKDKLAFGMFFMPILNILDLKDYSVKGVRIQGFPDFTPKEKIPHFIDVDSDENFIYALYSGEQLKTADSYPKNLYIFDWDGNIKYKYELPNRVTSLQVLNGKLYLLDYLSGSIRFIHLSDIICEQCVM